MNETELLKRYQIAKMKSYFAKEWIVPLKYAKKRRRCEYCECRKLGDNCGTWGFLCKPHRTFGAHLNTKTILRDIRNGWVVK